MRYLTKKWYKDLGEKCNFPLQLEIIDKDKNNLEEIFVTQYEKTFNNMKSTLPKNCEEYIFKNIFNGYIKNVKKFFDNETLNKVADIRLLALGKVFKEEYAFVEAEIIRKDPIQAYNKQFKEIEDTLPINIKQNLDLHDSLITNIIKQNDKMIIELDGSNSFTDVKSIIFSNYTILEENMNFINGYCLYEEIYIVDNQYELHLLIDVPKNNKPDLGNFTIKAENIVFKI